MKRKKTLIWILGLLLLPLSYAWTPQDSCFTETGNGTAHSNSSGDFLNGLGYDNMDDGFINQTIWQNDTAGGGTITESNGLISIISASRTGTHLKTISNLSGLNYTCDFQIKYSASPETGNGLWELRNFSAVTDSFAPTGFQWMFEDFGGDATLDMGRNGGEVTSTFTYGTSIINATLQIEDDGDVCGYIGNGSKIGCYTGYGAVNSSPYLRFSTNGNQEKSIGRLRCYRGSVCPAASAASPPAVQINNTIPIINISYPSNRSTIDNSSALPITINGTVTVQNGTILNISINNTNFRNVGNQTLFNFTFNGTLVEQRYDILLNATSQYGNSTIAIVSFTIDLSDPSITATTLSSNHSLFYIHKNITFQINYSDNIKIFHINISTGSYSLEITNINQSTFIFNGSINASTFGLGRNFLNTSFCDAHTSKKISQWEIQKNSARKELRFNFGNDHFLVKPQDAALIETFDEEKKEDRYLFKYTKKTINRQEKQSFIVSSSQKIEIVGNDKGYYGWLVIPNLKKWVDFNLKDGATPEYRITRIDPYSVLVEIDGITSDSFTFQSAGDLNCNSRVYSYYLFNYTAVFASSAVESTTETIKLIIDFRDIRLAGNGTLNYNGVDYNTSNRTASNQINLSIDLTIPQPPSNASNLTFFWNFILNTSSFTTSNFSQLVERVRLSTCNTEADLRVLNISIFNENQPSQYLEADVAAVLTTWTNNSGNTLNFTFDFRGDTNYTICLFPNTSLNVDAYFQYNTSGGFRQRWYLTNARLTANISKLFLFNFESTSGISTLKGTLKDNTFAFFPLVVAKLQRFYPTENLWRTVQIDRSDDFGLVLFNIIETTTDYLLIFEKDGAELSRTNPSKFKCTSSLCDLTFIVTVSSTPSSAEPVFSTGFNNLTRIYQLNFSDTTGLTSSARLKITKEDKGSVITICDTTVSASSGTINCNVTGYDGTLVARIYSSASPEIPKLVEYITILANALFKKTNQYVSKNELAFWSMGISITLIFAGAITVGPIGGVLMYIISLVAIYAFGILNFVTIGFITLMASIGAIVASLISKRS